MDKFKEVLEKNTTNGSVYESRVPETIHPADSFCVEDLLVDGLKNKERRIPIPPEFGTKRRRGRYLRFLQTNLQSYPKDAIEFAKVIRQHGRSRSYYLSFVKKLIDFDFILLDKSFGTFKLRKFELEGLELETIYMWEQMGSWKKKSFLDMFSVYCRLTQPILAFYLLRKRSFRKKKKVFVTKYIMKMAEVENRMGKLSHQIRDVYFLKRNRKTVGHSKFSTMRFLKEEFFLVDNSLLMRKKQSVYRTRGYRAMNSMLIQTRHE